MVSPELRDRMCHQMSVSKTTSQPNNKAADPSKTTIKPSVQA